MVPLYQVRAQRPKMILLSLPSLYLPGARLVNASRALHQVLCHSQPEVVMPARTPARTDTANGEVVTAGLMDKFHVYMLDRAHTADDRGSDVMRDQAERILTAEDEDAIWDADQGGTIQARDVPGLMVEIHGYEPVISNRTDIENSAGYYLSMSATVLGGPDEILTRNGLSIGQEFTLQTGAALLMTKVRAMEAGGYLPMRTLIKEYTTQNDNKVLKFARMPRIAQTS